MDGKHQVIDVINMVSSEVDHDKEGQEGHQQKVLFRFVLFDLFFDPSAFVFLFSNTGINFFHLQLPAESAIPFSFGQRLLAPEISGSCTILGFDQYLLKTVDYIIQ